MKTSNKILTSALAVIIIFLVISNIALKKEIEKIKKEQKIELINKVDTLSNDSSNVKININMN